jgi:hypothetical protein
LIEKYLIDDGAEAHNRDSDLDIFQVAPGKTGKSLKLASETGTLS